MPIYNNTVSSAVEHLRTEMNRIASKLPEYPIVMEMCGVGTSLGPQLMAEIGDIFRFTRREHLTAFAGVDPGAMDKKRSEGKPYYVYMTVGANKFLRVYYGRVREYLYSLSETE